MKVEVLYFTGCPNHAPAVTQVREVLQQEAVSAETVEVEVNDADAARALCFLGSPTIRVNGQDVETSARDAQAFGLTCRTYAAGGYRAGLPPVEWLRAAIREARNNRGGVRCE